MPLWAAKKHKTAEFCVHHFKIYNPIVYASIFHFTSEASYPYNYPDMLEAGVSCSHVVIKKPCKCLSTKEGGRYEEVDYGNTCRCGYAYGFANGRGGGREIKSGAVFFFSSRAGFFGK
jgi:hypothetical protein